MAELRVERKRRYKVLLPVAVSLEDGSYGYGDEFEHEFSAEDEWGHVDSGLLGLVPEWYIVSGDSTIEVNLVEVPARPSTDPVTGEFLPTYRPMNPGDTFLAAIPLAREQQLIFHVRRVPPPDEPEPPTKPSKPAKPAPSTKE
jgi:hypothetical protein